MVSLRERLTQRTAEYEETRTRSKEFKARKALVQVARGKKGMGDVAHIVGYNPDNPPSMNTETRFTLDLAAVDAYIKEGSYNAALEKLESDEHFMGLSSGFPEKLKPKLAAAIHRRAYRISNALAKNKESYRPEVDARAVTLVEKIEEKYHIKPHPALEESLATTAIIGLLGGVFFLSANITGNVIANLSTSTASFLGAGLFILGLIAGFFWFKKTR